MQIHSRLVQTFKSGVTRPLAYRRHQLLQLARLIQENIGPLEDAVLADLGKQRQETTLTELAPMVTAALYAVQQLEEWTRPEKPRVDPFRSSWDATVYPVPKGVALIISCVHAVPTAPRTSRALLTREPTAPGTIPTF